MGGDFNVYYDFFKPRVQSYGKGKEIANWASICFIEFLGEIGKAIHVLGHVLNLTFNNILFARSEIKEDLQIGSDHATQITTLLGTYRNVSKNKLRYRVIKANLGKFAALIEAGFQALLDTNLLYSSIEIKAYSCAIKDIFHIVIKSAKRLNTRNKRAAL